MKLEQSFEVAAPLERVWTALIDVERVAPCLPGAAVTGRNDDGSYTGEFKVKIGPTSAAYTGRLHMENVDVAGHTATMLAAGTDKRGQGGAKATIVSTVTPAGDGETTVAVSTDYHITGRLARFGRGGMIEEISAKLLGEFAKNLQAMLSGEEETSVVAAPAPLADDPNDPDDPDDAIDGATPVAEVSAAGAAAPESEPISAVSLVGSVVVRRVRENPAPVALLLGFLVALRVLRRRS
jgi:carbon monoxide dehydrogenase subunit G